MYEYVWVAIVAHSKQLLGFGLFFLTLEYFLPIRREQRRWRNDSRLDISFSYLGPFLVLPFYVGTVWVLTSWLLGNGAGVAGTSRLQVLVSEPPSNGTAVVKENGEIQYVPKPGFVGTDHFSSTVTRGGLTILRRIDVSVEREQGEESRAPEDDQRIISFSASERVLQGPAGRRQAGLLESALSLRAKIRQWGFIWQWVVSILVLDFVGYWRHRLMHTKHLWNFHAIHHSSESLDWLSNERNHPVNQYIIAVVNLVIMVAVFHPVVVAANVTSRRAYSLFLHANAKLSYGPLNYVFTSPVFHHWHHSDERVAMDKNFAIYFSFFDWLFGTFYLPETKEFPESYGLHQSAIRPNLATQLAHPFQQLNPLRSRKPSGFASTNH